MKRTRRVVAPTTVRKYNVKRSKKNMVSTFTSKNSTAGGISNVLPVKMLYADTYLINPGALGVVDTQIFRLSSIHDPDLTGVGHQPLGHDQLEPLFERYQVWKVDFEIEALSLDNQPQGIAYSVSDSSTTNPDPRLMLENGNGEFAILGNDHDHKAFRGSVLLNEIHGISYKQYMANDDYGAAFGSNPAEIAYLLVYTDGCGTDTSGIRLRVRLTYHVKLMGSKVTALS